MTTTPRAKKTPRQRAEEALAAAGRKVARLAVAVDKARITHEQLQAELDQAQQRFEYVTHDPALPPSPTRTPGETR